MQHVLSHDYVLSSGTDVCSAAVQYLSKAAGSL